MKPEEFLIPSAADLENESVVFCGMLRDSSAAATLSEELEADDFSAFGRLIFAAIVKTWSESTQRMIDPELVLAELVRSTPQPADKWRESLLNILESDPSGAACYSRAKLVRERSLRKKLVQAASEVISDAINPATSAEDLVGIAQSKFLAIGSVGKKQQTVTFRQAVREVTDQLDSGVDRIGIQSGLKDFDDATGGFHAGELCIIAARPGVGKSALAVNVATNAAREGVPGLIISLEMSRVELASRYLCGRAEIDSKHLRRGRLAADEMARLIDVSHRAGSLPLLINDTGTLRSRDIRAITRKAKATCGIKFVVVDYLQLLTPEDARSNRVDQVGEMSRSLKLLARDLEISVICLAQLNRQVEQRTEGKPRLSDLRESGSIEQDADTVIFLYRLGEPRKEDPVDKINCAIAKQRNGPTNDAVLAFRKSTMTFENFCHGVPT